MLRNLTILSLTFVLAGCIAQSDIQAKYMGEQDDCRSHVQSSLSSNQVDASGAPINAGVLFSECMNKLGWRVSSPKGTVVATNPPTGSPSTNPSAALSLPAPGQPTQTAIVQNPPSGAPSTNPSAALSKVSQPQPAPGGSTPNLPGGAASTNPSAAIPSAKIPKPAVAQTSPVTGKTGIAPAAYQPARPIGTPATNYSGAGRQF